MDERSRETPEVRRRQLLDLGLRLFGARSYEDVSIEDIAREAKVSKGLMYHYFGNKRAFYTEVVRFAATQVLHAVVPKPGTDQTEALRKGLRAFFDFVDKRASAYLALQHGGLGVDGQVQPAVERVREAVVDTILQLTAANEQNGLLRSVLRGWVGFVESSALSWVQNRDHDVDALIDILAATLIVQLPLVQRHSTETRLTVDATLNEYVLSELQQAFGTVIATAPVATQREDEGSK